MASVPDYLMFTGAQCFSVCLSGASGSRFLWSWHRGFLRCVSRWSCGPRTVGLRSAAGYSGTFYSTVALPSRVAIGCVGCVGGI